MKLVVLKEIQKDFIYLKSYKYDFSFSKFLSLISPEVSINPYFSNDDSSLDVVSRDALIELAIS